MKYWLATQWPTTTRADASAAGALTPAPPDRILIAPFQPTQPRQTRGAARREPLPTRWPAADGLVVLARVVRPLNERDETRRRRLIVDRDSDCWIRILDMKLPNYDRFDPREQIERILGLDDRRRGAAEDRRDLFRLSEAQFNRLLRLFATRDVKV